MMNSPIPSIYMTYEHDFVGMRYQEERLVPTNWKLTVNLYGPEVGTIDDIDAQTQDSSVMFKKLIFWLESALDCCLVASAHEISEVGGFYNTKVMLPGYVPSDDVFLQVLHAKLSAIAGDDMNVGHMMLFSGDTNTTYNYHHPGEYDLPHQDEFMGDNALHDEPWWFRCDGDTYDISKDHVQADELLETPSMLDEFEEHIRTVMYGEPVMEQAEPAEIIPVNKWKPRKV